jgi:hypothetical protein
MVMATLLLSRGNNIRFGSNEGPGSSSYTITCMISQSIKTLGYY